LHKPTINLRLAVICMAAASVGLSMAIVSIFKLSRVVCGLIVLRFNRYTGGSDNRFSGPAVPCAALIAVFAFAFAAGLLWTAVPVDEVFLPASSRMPFSHLPVPWATSSEAWLHFSVLSSHLGQVIISATLLVLALAPSKRGPGQVWQTCGGCLRRCGGANVLFVLSGRSRHERIYG
jgi:O-antigen ligase